MQKCILKMCFPHLQKIEVMPRMKWIPSILFYRASTKQGPQEGQNFDRDGFGSHFEPVEVVWGNFGVIFGPFWDHSGPICGPELKINADQSCDHSKRPQEEQNSDGDGFGSHFDDIEAISGTFLQFLGHFGVIWCHSWAQNDLNILKLSLETIIICILLPLRSF